jgi:arylformamidase
MSPTIVELSHLITDGMPTYPGLPRPRIDLHLDHAASRARYAGQAEFAVGHLEFVGNVGTYLDSPYHRYPDGDDVAALPLGRLVGLPVVVIDCRDALRTSRRLDPLIAGCCPLAGKAVLLRTDWDRRWGTQEYWESGPHLGTVAVQQLLHCRPALVGVDCSNVDDPADLSRPVHTALLGAGIPIVEHLRDLATVSDDARLFVVPLPVRGVPSLPVRVFAMRWQELSGS